MHEEYHLPLGQNYWSASKQLHESFDMKQTPESSILVEYLYGFKIEFNGDRIYLNFASQEDLVSFVIQWGAT